MPVLTRHIQSVTFKGISCLGAVRLEDRIVAHLSAAQKPDDARAAFGSSLQKIDGHRNTLRVSLDRSVEIEAHPPELDLFSGMNVLFAFRDGETKEAVADWLQYHMEREGADAALIFDRSAPDERGFADGLQSDAPVLVVTADYPLGRPDGPDQRHPNSAPAHPKRMTVPADAWHGPIVEHGVADLLRFRFLLNARAVAFLQIADLVTSQSGGKTVFEAAMETPGQAVPMRGVEIYPWRLRQGQPAPHSDHISSRRTERRRFISWALALGAEGPRSFWRPVQPIGIDAAPVDPVPFVRAMGVRYPGVPVNKLVRKGDLREQKVLLDLMKQAFEAEPIRLPSPAFIEPRPSSARLTVVTAMKNEGPFILDWVAHNRAIGVDHILVYTNDCDDGTAELLDGLRDAGVTRRDNPYRETGKVPQYAAFRAAENETIVQDADWLLTLDVDEYLNIHAGEGRLDDLFAAMPEAHVVSIPWRMFGNADHHMFQDTPVSERFTRCAPEYAPRPLQAWAFKTL